MDAKDGILEAENNVAFWQQPRVAKKQRFGLASSPYPFLTGPSTFFVLCNS